ncbi:hypothetical protein [Tenggerimyces flavus]|uniref:Peptidylprolyl isomerase n=1 Tax=Tenggerimyces flavus TaxID=1708749 RepID=A0ABV7YKH9_9ACTN|nr:hypothetical protein [Tenggerimyces flavus]MBM7789890.1 hypothetical protein [Tenggerimyces flavus]
MGRTLLALAAVVTTLVLAAACSPSSSAVTSPDIRVATVDGLPVVVGELQRELRRSRGAISADQALRRIVEIKVQQARMLREGVIQTADYSSYLGGAEKENARRKAALHKGEAVYGPTELEPDYYFGYRFDTEVVALKERLAARELRPAEADLRAFHESVKTHLTDFEQNKERIHALWLDQEYRALIQAWVRQAEVDIDHEVLDRIPLQ